MEEGAALEQQQPGLPEAPAPAAVASGGAAPGPIIREQPTPSVNQIKTALNFFGFSLVCLSLFFFYKV